MPSEQYMHFHFLPQRQLGNAVAQLVEALHYRAEGRGFDFRWRHRDVTEMSTRNIFWEVMAAGAYG
jgi:hypothetical protein